MFWRCIVSTECDDHYFFFIYLKKILVQAKFLFVKMFYFADRVAAMLLCNLLQFCGQIPQTKL